MKKAIKTFFTLLFMTLTISGVLAAEKTNKSQIKTVDNYVAIFDFEVRDKDKDISRPLADKVIHVFSESNKYEVIDRGNMNKILGEQKFQMSGCVAQECKVEAGQILGVGKIVNGSVGLVGKTYYLTIQLIDVETGKVELSAEDECKCEIDELLGSTRRLAKKLLGEKAEEIVATTPAPPNVSIAIPKPPDLVVAAIAKPEPKITNSIGMTFVYIKPGTFMMGSPSDEQGRFDNETQHQVTLTKGYYMQTTEVTQGQWRAVMGNNPSSFSNCGNDCPVESVSWNDVKEFIRQLNQKEGSSYRLPTEAEWEYACRAGTNTRFYFGDSDSQLGNYAWTSAFFGKIHPVAQKQPNSWGFYDIQGNVLELCQDWFGDYPSGSVIDPDGPMTGSRRVYRGCGSVGGGTYCRSAYRGDVPPDVRFNPLGFRLARIP